VKLVCDREGLVAALTGVARVATSRGGVQVLAGVRLGVENGTLTLAATDMELSCRGSIEVDAQESGVVVVPARALLDIVRRIQSQDVTLTAESADGVLRVTNGESDYALNAYSAMDFPALPPYASGLGIEVDRVLFLDTVARVVRAASTDASRPVYTGVRMSIGRGEVNLAATDGYRLASKTTALRTSGELAEALIPARALQELARLATAGDSLRITLTPNLIAFELPDFVLTSRRLDGEQQRHEHILTGTFTHHARVAREELLEAVDRAAVIVHRNSPIELTFSDTELRLRVRSPELGEANERVKLRGPGPTIRIGFNASFFRDGVELVHGDEIRFKMNDGIRPAVLQGPQDDFAYLVAPIRLSE
jgi:DNA polymerase III subunit beta